jgi:hypothetical protein
MAPYERPFRHVLAATWRRYPDLRLATVLTAVLWVGGTVGAYAARELFGFVAGLGVVAVWVVALLWVAMLMREGWRLTRSWHRRTDLGVVRARRPQAGEEDPELAHDEFAVTVEEDGHLVVWRFRPLSVTEEPDDRELEIPGRPRYAASPVGHEQFDVQDAARAAEQLVAAQERAAARESAAAAAADHAADDAGRLADLEIETRSMAAALQRITGQRTRRD